MSTTLLMGRSPTDRSRFRNQGGDGPTAMPSMTRTAKRGHPCGSWIRTLRAKLGGCHREERIGDFGRWLAQALAEGGGQLAGDPDVAETVRPVRGHVEVEDGVEVEHLAERLPRHTLLKDEDPVRVVADAKLDRRTEHAGRLVPADRLDAESLVHRRWACSRGGVGHEVAGLDVGRTGHDPDGSRDLGERRKRSRHRRAEIDVRELQMRRPGDWRDRRDPGDDDPLAADLDGADLCAGVGQRTGDRGYRRVQRRVVAEPAQREFHDASAVGTAGAGAGCRNRTSLS